MKHLKYFNENFNPKVFSAKINAERFTPLNIKRIVDNYLRCALWVADDENNFEDKTIYDFSDEAERQAKKEIEWFVDAARDAIVSTNISDDAIGHDLWLTRNNHGAGFWDRGYKKEDEEELSELCKILGEVWIELGDDGKIYFTPSDEYKKFDIEKWKEERKLKRDTKKYNL